MWAAAQNQPEMVKLLVKHGANVNARSTVNNWQRQVTAEPRAQARPIGGLTPLLYAARQGCLECVKTLVEAKAEVDMPDPEGVTPLIMAITNFHFDIASAICSRSGANPNKWDWWGRTPLYSAVDLNTIPHGGRPDRLSLDDDDEPEDHRDAARTAAPIRTRSSNCFRRIARSARIAAPTDADHRCDAAAARREGGRRARR